MKYRKRPVVIEAYRTEYEVVVETLNGATTARAGDWILTGTNGEQWPCKPDIFEKTYEPYTDATPAVFTAADLAKAREEGRMEAERKFWPIFLWLLGYTDFPERQPGDDAFYWRTKLRRDLEETITDFAALLEKEGEE